MGHMDQMVADAQSSVLTGDLNDLAEALEEASEEGGADAEGGVVIGKKGAKSRLRRTNVLARDVKLKNTSQEQAKDFSSQLKELGRQTAQNPALAEKLGGSFESVKNSLKSGEMEGKDLAKILAGMQDQASKAESSGKNSLAQQLQNAGKPVHAQSNAFGAKEVTVQTVQNGFSGQVDGKNFKVNADNKSLQLQLSGKNVEVKVGADGKLGATTGWQALWISLRMKSKLTPTFFALMALFHEMGVEQRQMSRQGRNMANKSVVGKIKAQAKEQRSAAAAKMVAGMIGGAVKVASGALNMAGSMKGMKADQAAGGNSQMGNMIAQQWSAMGKMVEGLGEAGASTLQYKAGLHEARSTELRAEEEQARFVKQTEQDQMQVAQELSTKARDTFAQTWNQFLQTQQNITRNI